MAAGAGVALLFVVVDVGGGLVPAEGFFVFHGMIGLMGGGFAEVDQVKGLAFAAGAAGVVVGVELAIAGVGVGDGGIHVVRNAGGGGAADGGVEVAHAGFFFRLGAIVAGGGIGGAMRGSGAILGGFVLGHGDSL